MKIRKNYQMLRVNDLFRLTTIYVDCNNQEIHVPSLIYDSVGTNKFVNLLINIINAILKEESYL